MSFINSYSYKCLFGSQTKAYSQVGNLLLWTVNSKKHFSVDGTFTTEDIEYLRSYLPANFHYINESNLSLLKSAFKLKRVKNKSILLNISDISLEGAERKKLRQTYNRCAKNEFEILDNYKNISDVKVMIDEWSNEYAADYFRDYSGKNLYFYKNNFHLDCMNVFIYKDGQLVSFGTLSPEVDGSSSYIIGKALYKRYYGLSEFTDIELYKKAVAKNIKVVNMGQASHGLVFYKKKFFNSVEEVHYDGNIEACL